jgi:hypothetical protein
LGVIENVRKVVRVVKVDCAGGGLVIMSTRLKPVVLGKLVLLTKSPS